MNKPQMKFILNLFLIATNFILLFIILINQINIKKIIKSKNKKIPEIIYRAIELKEIEEKENMKIPEGYVDEFVNNFVNNKIKNYKIDYVNICDIKICHWKNSVCDFNDLISVCNDDNPQLLYLRNINKEEFLKRRQEKKGEFDKTIKNLEKGYDPRKGIIIINANNVIADGAHRASVLFHKYGQNYKVKVLRIFN